MRWLGGVVVQVLEDRYEVAGRCCWSRCWRTGMRWLGGVVVQVLEDRYEVSAWEMLLVQVLEDRYEMAGRCCWSRCWRCKVASGNHAVSLFKYLSTPHNTCDVVVPSDHAE